MGLRDADGMEAFEPHAITLPGLEADGFKGRARDILALADVAVGGSRPWDIAVHNELFYARALCRGSLGLGESYVDGWWDCQALDEFFTRVFGADIGGRVSPWGDTLNYLRALVLNLQCPSRAFEVAKRHYDLGNDLFSLMLDRRMIYSCGYWKDALTLDEAQEAKLDLIARKLRIAPGMRVLDIGCGWGGTARYLAERTGASVVGVTVSREQAESASRTCSGLPIEIRLEDYRLLRQRFDRIVSVGMFEHVGYKNYRTFFEVVRRCLADDGLFLLHTIGRNVSASHMDPWVERHIFPNAMLPSPKQISASSEGLFVIEDWHNFGPDYDRTLMEWHGNFSRNLHALSPRYDKRFHRMWRYYLLSCAGSFRARRNQLWQIVFSPGGLPGGYIAPR